MKQKQARWQMSLTGSTSKTSNSRDDRAIAFGPYISKTPGPVTKVDGFEATGFSIELATADQALMIPIFRDTRQNSQPSFDDYVCFTCDVPFKVPYEWRPYAYYSGGLYVTLESILVTLYSDYKVAKPIFDVLTEFRECLPVHLNGPYKPIRMHAVIPEVAELGFDVFTVLACGKSLTLLLEWIFPQDRAQTGPVPRVSAGSITFRPQPDKTLDRGKWITPKYGNIFYVMHRVFRKHYQGSPFDLLTPEGRKAALEKFEWTPMSLLTPAQRRQAKIDFARKHPHLLNRPKELAVALKKAKFYYRSTPPGIIAKHLRSIIAEAKRPLE